MADMSEYWNQKKGSVTGRYYEGYAVVLNEQVAVFSVDRRDLERFLDDFLDVTACERMERVLIMRPGLKPKVGPSRDLDLD